MTETRIKTVLRLIGEGLVIWYGMGTPIPTNVQDTIKLLVALGAIIYTGWKNHDFTGEGEIGTALTRQLKYEKNETVIDDDEYLEDEDLEEDDDDGITLDR